jgi:hypothetical protein
MSSFEGWSRGISGRLVSSFAAAVFLFTVSGAWASENVPHRPFGLWADVPEAGQFIAGLVYSESEAYHIHVDGHSHNVTWHAGGESYGIDMNQGYLAFQYGITERWAADLNVGMTTVGWRYFANGQVESTTGFMDISFGVRYQLLNETNACAPWVPTLTARAGGVLAGSYDESFAFSPGAGSAAFEPELLLRKHVGWPGLGLFADGLYRWNQATYPDQYMVAIGFFQEIKGWELDVGYRHLQTLSGGDISFDPAQPTSLVYPRNVREISDALEAGFSYTTAKRHLRYGFQCRSVLAGNNTDRKFWVGGSFDIPFGGHSSK